MSSRLKIFLLICLVFSLKADADFQITQFLDSSSESNYSYSKFRTVWVETEADLPAHNYANSLQAFRVSVKRRRNTPVLTQDLAFSADLASNKAARNFYNLIPNINGEAKLKYQSYVAFDFLEINTFAPLEVFSYKIRYFGCTAEALKFYTLKESAGGKCLVYEKEKGKITDFNGQAYGKDVVDVYLGVIPPPSLVTHIVIALTIDPPINQGSGFSLYNFQLFNYLNYDAALAKYNTLTMNMRYIATYPPYPKYELTIYDEPGMSGLSPNFDVPRALLFCTDVAYYIFRRENNLNPNLYSYGTIYKSLGGAIPAKVAEYTSGAAGITDYVVYKCDGAAIVRESLVETSPNYFPVLTDSPQ